ncbi:hypothetical protein GCM10018779_49320 [Streptomyces griseocarneus]|nr:hypothetical protein GCM10018779_49320 [Streptomyces griseocarneus]
MERLREPLHERLREPYFLAHSIGGRRGRQAPERAVRKRGGACAGVPEGAKCVARPRKALLASRRRVERLITRVITSDP